MQGTGSFEDGNVTALGKGGQAAGANIYVSGGGTFEFRVANDYAAHVYLTLHDNIPRANAKLSRSRGPISVYVADADPAYGIFYDPNVDRILTNFTRVFTEDGYFVSTHEYGHAFQYKAIEPWATYACDNNSHSINVADSHLSCAFVEGFADFFSGWVGGHKLTSGWSGGFLTDNALEQNPWRSIGDGSRIEGGVAAFLYDLVDGTNEPDGPANTADGEESFDGATYPGSYVADLIRTCQLTYVLTATRLDGIDQFVYCAERSLDARGLGTNWRPYTTFSEGATEPATWSKAVIRKLWRYNLYNVAP